MVSWTFWVWIGMLKTMTEPALMETAMTHAKNAHETDIGLSAVDELSPRLLAEGLPWSRDVAALLQKKRMFM